MIHLFNPTNIISTYGYIGIFIVIFLESGIFFPLPGDSLIFTAGLLAASLGFNIAVLALIIFIAAYLGGLAGYYIGTKLDILYRFAFFRKTIRPEYIERARTFFERHGLAAILLSRFMPVIRTFLPIVAGMAKMEFADFLNYSFWGALIWSASFTLSGYFLGKAFPQIQNYLLYVVIAVVIISIIPGIIAWIRSRKNL